MGNIPKANIINGNTINAADVSNIINALDGTTAYDITISGSLAINTTESPGSGHVITYNTSSGTFTYTSSAAIGGGGIPDLQQVTTAGATTTVGVSVDNGAGESIGIKNNLIKITNALGEATITSPILTTSTEFQIPDKVTGPQTFAMLSDITGSGSGSTSPGGPEQAIQFNSGSTFSGSSNLTFNYVNNTAQLTGSLLITGSQIVSGGFDVHANSNAYYGSSFHNINNGASSLTELQILNGSGVSGSKINIQAYSRAYTDNLNYAGNVLYFISPEDSIGNVNRPVKFITAIVAAPANNNSFEWHHSGSYGIAPSTLKMKLDVPSGILSNSGSIITSGSLTIASGSVNTSADCALYFGASGSIGSWRIAPEGANLVIQKWNGTNYSGGTTITP